MDNTTIPNNTNINEIIADISKNNTSLLLKTVVNSIKFVENVDVGHLKKQVKKFNQVGDIISEYLSSTNKIFKELNSAPDKNLIDLLGAVEEGTGEFDKNKKEITKTRYRNIDAINQISNIFGIVINGIKSLDNLDTGFFAMYKLQKKVRSFNKVFEQMTLSIVKMLTKMPTTQLKESLFLLTNDPQTVITVSNSKTQKSGESIIDELNTENKTTTGREGLIDIIAKIFGVVDALIKYEPPKGSQYEKNIKVIQKQLDLIVGSLVALANKYSNDKKQLQEFNKILVVDEGLTDVISNMQMVNSLIAKTANMFKGTKKKSIDNTFECISTSLDWIYLILNDEAVKGLVNEKTVEKINQINNNVRKFSDVCNTIKSLIWIGTNIKAFSTVIIAGINSVFDVLIGMKTKIKEYSEDPIDKKVLDDINELFENLKNTIEHAVIFGLLTLPFLMFYKPIKWGIAFIFKLCEYISEKIKDLKVDKSAGEQIYIISEIIGALTSIAKRLLLFGLYSILLIPMIPAIWIGLLFVKWVVDRINAFKKLNINKKAITKLLIVKNIIAILGIIIGELLLITPLLALFIIASPLILLCFYGFVLIFNILMKIINLLISPNVELALIKLILFAGALGIIFTEFVLIAILAKIFIKHISDLLLGILGITLIVIAIAGLGFVLSLITPVLLSATIGILVLTMAVGSLLIIVGTLWLLQHIELDKDTILNNVNTIMDVSIAIITSLFESPVIGGKKTDNIFTKMIKAFGGSIGAVLLSISAATMLIATVASVGAMLLLVFMLKDLQNLKDFDAVKIKENVSIIMNTALSVINSIFISDNIKKDKSKESWYEPILNWFGNVFSGIGSIISGILSVGFLAVTMVSVGMIWILKHALTSLQDLKDFDTVKIKENVSIIIGTAMDVMSCIFKSDETSSSPSDKTWLSSFFEWAKNSWLGRVINGVGSLIEGILSIGFLAITLATVGMVVLIAKSLNYISTIKFDKNIITQKVLDIMDCARAVQNAIFNPTNTKADLEAEKQKKENDTGVLDSIFNWIKDKIGATTDVLGALSSLGYLSTMIASVGLVHKLAGQLDSINKIENLSDVPNKVKTLVSISDEIITELLKSNINNIKSIQLELYNIQNNYRILINVLSELSNMVNSISNFKNNVLFETINDTIIGLNKTTNLLIENKISKNNIRQLYGIIRNYNQLKNTLLALNDISNSIYEFKEIVSFDVIDNNIIGLNKTTNLLIKNKININTRQLYNIIRNYNQLKNVLLTLDDISNSIYGFKGISSFENINNTISYINEIIDNLIKKQLTKKINELYFKSRNIINILNILKSSNKVLSEFIDISDKQVENNSKVLNNYIKFVDKINTIKTTNIEKTANLFRHMAEFSKSINGDFDELANSLNEKIAPLLEELKDILEKIPNDIKTSSDNIGQTITNNAAGPIGWDNNIIKRNVSNYAEEDRPKIAREMERKSAEAKAEESKIIDLLGDILDALTGNGIYQGVKTI